MGFHMQLILKASAIVLLAAAISGCAGHTRPVGPEKKLTGARRSFDALWLGSLDVLREYNFVVERQDRRAGIITTGRIVGEHFSEPWRKDAATTFDVIEGTIQTIYRTATVSIHRVDDASGTHFTANVEVDVSRSNRPEAQISSTSEAYDMFTVPGGGAGKLLVDETGTGAKGSSVVSLGRDKNLEVRLSAEISTAAARYMTSLP